MVQGGKGTKIMEQVSVSILQMSSVVGDVDANISKVGEMISKSLPDNTDVLVLPEVWTVGWDCSYFTSSAQPIDGSVCKFLSDTAKRYNINIIGGSFIEKSSDKYYNTCPVFNRQGKLVTTYSKMHLYSYYGCDEGSYVSEGNSPVMVCLDGISYGLSICYDIRFPEIYRSYAKAGADVLVNCAAWGSKKSLVWEIMTKSRAVENQTYMVALTQSGKISNNEYNLGESRIIDYKGEELSAIMSGEGFANAVLNIPEMREFRAKAPTVNDIKNDYEVKVLCER